MLVVPSANRVTECLAPVTLIGGLVCRLSPVCVHLGLTGSLSLASQVASNDTTHTRVLPGSRQVYETHMAVLVGSALLRVRVCVIGNVHFSSGSGSKSAVW